jgi:Tol biopolymer transport system component
MSSAIARHRRRVEAGYARLPDNGGVGWSRVCPIVPQRLIVRRNGLLNGAADRRIFQSIELGSLPVSRRNVSALLVSIVVLVAVGAWLIWLSLPPRLPSLRVGKQITHDGLVKTNLVSDGGYLYFTEVSRDRSVISKVAANGGDVTQVSLPFPSAQLLDVSAAHGAMLAAESTTGSASEQPIWLSSLHDGTAKRFGAMVGQKAVWSPDGQHVLIVKGSSLIVTDAAGGSAKELATVQGTPYYPRYSPDGRRVRFSIGDVAHNTSTIWEVRSDGSDLHAFLPDWHAVSTKCCGSWTADGRYYIFQATRSELGGTANLWGIAEPSSRFEKKRFDQPVELTQGATSFGRPAPDADNKNIWALGLRLHGTVQKYDAQSGEYTPYLSGISATDLDFSPDRQWVTYVSVPDGALWRCRIDGSEPLQLTFSPVRAALPRWSRDGKQIAYVNVLTDRPWAIFVVSNNGGSSQSLLSEENTEIDINWSLEGDKIIFGRLTQLKPEGLSIEVYDLHTHKLSAIPGSEGLFSPRLSPDGHYIAALSANLTKLMLYDTQRQKWSEWQTLASGALNYPVWSEDSKSIYFDDLVGGEGAYCRAKVGESHYEHVFVLAGLERYPGLLGLWAGRAPDGSPLFVSDTSTGEVYRLEAKLP